MINDEGPSDCSNGTTEVPQPILLGLPQGISFHNSQFPYCPYHRATSVRCSPVVTADAHQYCVTIARDLFLFLARSLASLTSILLSFRPCLTPSIQAKDKLRKKMSAGIARKNMKSFENTYEARPF